MILLAETPELLLPSASRDDIAKSLEAARLTGWQVVAIPPDFTQCETAENALWQLQEQTELTTAFWLGYIPEVARYEAIYGAAAAKNVWLVNSPEQHQTAQEFDKSYPFLEGLTPCSVFADSVEIALELAPEIGFPIFVKGAVQSRKSRGWKACVAENEAELAARVSELLELENRSRGRVILREVVKLRHTRSHGDFPLGREYRAFVLNGEIVGLGYYWPGEDDAKNLSASERAVVEELALEVASRVKTPYLSVDIGQLENGDWIVIEIGDAQFSGLSGIVPLELWYRLKSKLEAAR